MDLLAFIVGDHDSNVCALSAGQLRFRKFERLSGVKHERAPLEKIVDTCRAWQLQPEYVAFTDVGDLGGLGIAPPEDIFCEIDALECFPDAKKTIRVDHHFAHALSGQLGADRSRSFLAVAMDGLGDHDFRARCFRIGPDLDAVVTFESKRFRVSDFFYRVGQRLALKGADLDYAGKLMGLQAYGKPDPEFIGAQASVPFDELPERLLTEIPFRGHAPGESTDFFRPSRNPDLLSWLASCHEALMHATFRLFETMSPHDEPIEFTGGVAQNSVFNEFLARSYPGFTVTAHPYDGGISFGCLHFLIRMLGLPALEVPAYPFLQDDEDVGFAEEGVQERVSALVAEGKVVGWMQGRGEVGPRALGHRSILFDPRKPTAKDVLNERVKFRESWRPFAASIPLDDASDWLEIGPPSPWMQRALVVRPDRRADIPGVVHVDGTCRAQTVDSAGAEGLDSFLGVVRHFEARTGMPVLLNTSLNSGGEPIYGSRTQAEALLASGRLDALCVGNDLMIG